MLGGVCGGLASYLNMDATLIRILVVILSVFTGGSLLLVYLIALFVMPEETPSPPPSYPPVSPGTASDPVWGASGAPWEQPQPAPQPGDGTEPGDSREPR
jgi:phage shock protein PspC (stress-responsive transcriptional regulator)